MKYIFRCALLLNFTDNREGVTIADLRDSLASLKYSCPNLEAVVAKWTNCIEELANNAPLKAETFASIVRNTYGAGVSEQQLQDLLSVWESQNQLIFIHRLKRSVGCASLDRLQWSVNNRMYGKHCQNVNQLATIVNMTLKQPTNEKTYITFELQKEEVEQLGHQLQSIEAAIDRIMSQPQQ